MMDGSEQDGAVGEAEESGIPGLAEAERIAQLEGEIAQLKDQALRALAESENVRRRLEREKEDVGRFAISGLARDLLSVADNLRRALDSVDPETIESETFRNLLAGVEATERELLGVFDRRGIKRIEPMGQPFDANFHQAMFEVPNSGQPAGTVVQVLQPGYVIHERLLRPALVGVAKGEEAGRVDTRV